MSGAAGRAGAEEGGYPPNQHPASGARASSGMQRRCGRADEHDRGGVHLRGAPAHVRREEEVVRARHELRAGARARGW